MRYVVPLLTVVAVTQVVHLSPLTSPTSGVISMLAVLACAWFGGLGPALLLSPLLLLLGRLVREEPQRWAAMTSQELMALTVVTLVCGSIGLAGQYRRRIRAVTEQHAQKLQDQARALNQAPIVFRNVEGTITEWSAGAQRLFGRTSDEAVGRPLCELLQTRFPRPADEIQPELFKTGQWQGEVIQRHRDGHELHVAMHWILYRDKYGEPIGVAEIHNDVSDLRRAEAAVREADRRKDEFLAMLAHELRNPLAPIRTGLELMRMAKNDEQLIDQTRAIMERQMEQLVTLVDDLLDVSRISRGKLELRMCQVTLSDVVRSAVEAARPTIEAAGHKLSVTMTAAPLHLHADPHRLAQVLSNLLDNAAKYTPRGGSIWLAAERQGADVVVSIKDSGLGIPADMIDGIFQMFTRIERAGEKTNAGLGIGLALVKSIVEMHGGRVEAKSDGPGRGAEFRVRLPLVRAATASEQLPNGASSATERSPRRVLIVDDNEAAADLLSMVVGKLGNEVRVAYDGQQAIEAAVRFQPDVVLMDLGMPKLDGYGAARHIREQPWGQEMLLVALSGWGQDGHKKRSKEAGFDHHLVKPADPVQLQRLLDGAEPRGTRASALEPSADS